MWKDRIKGVQAVFEHAGPFQHQLRQRCAATGPYFEFLGLRPGLHLAEKEPCLAVLEKRRPCAFLMLKQTSVAAHLLRLLVRTMRRSLNPSRPGLAQKANSRLLLLLRHRALPLSLSCRRWLHLVRWIRRGHFLPVKSDRRVEPCLFFCQHISGRVQLVQVSLASFCCGTAG